MSEDELLAEALGEMGGRGAQLAGRRLRKNVFEIELAMAMAPDAAVDRVCHVLAEQGRVAGVEVIDQSPVRRVAGIVAAGAANLNPAVVTVTIRPEDQGTQLLVRGAAREGLIKQRAGEKAARRVAAALADTP